MILLETLGNPIFNIIIFALFVAFTRILFRKDLRADEVHIDEVMALQERRAISGA